MRLTDALHNGLSLRCELNTYLIHHVDKGDRLPQSVPSYQKFSKVSAVVYLLYNVSALVHLLYSVTQHSHCPPGPRAPRPRRPPIFPYQSGGTQVDSILQLGQCLYLMCAESEIDLQNGREEGFRI
jgi:hypothetical protein